MADAATSTNVKDQAVSKSSALAQTLPSDAVLDALKMILLGAPLNEVLTAITRLIEAHSTEMLCSIFLLDEDGLHLRYGVAASLPEAYRAATDGLCVGPNVGSCGTAAYLRQPVFVSDIASDPRWVEFRDFALQSGLRGLLVNSHHVARRQSAGDIRHVQPRSSATGAGRNSVDRLCQPHCRNRHRARSIADGPDKGIRTDREIRSSTFDTLLMPYPR
jgi:hypothetical protein